jgi:hypothetical protein
VRSLPGKGGTIGDQRPFGWRKRLMSPPSRRTKARRRPCSRQWHSSVWNSLGSLRESASHIAVPCDTNKEATLAAHLPQMDLAGVCLTTDAAHLTKANCRQLTQKNGADFFIFLKGNQPTAPAKAEQLLPGNVHPQAGTLDKAHGRIELRELWCAPTVPPAVGLAGVAQVVRLHRHAQYVRQSKVYKETDDTVFAVTTFGPQ